ncbi:unnamed protein product [Ectocarpus sp. 8 AP-2014]
MCFQVLEKTNRCQGNHFQLGLLPRRQQSFDNEAGITPPAAQVHPGAFGSTSAPPSARSGRGISSCTYIHAAAAARVGVQGPKLPVSRRTAPG